MRNAYLALLLSAALPLSGCAALLERSYSEVQPHTSQYWEDATASALRAEDYQSLVNGLLMLISKQTDTGLVRLYGYADQAAAVHDMDTACAEVTMKDPLGAYLVDYMTYDCTEGTNCYEFTVRLTYQKTQAQLRAMVSATTAAALPDLLRTALSGGKNELVVKIGYMDRSADEIASDISTVMTEAGKAAGSWTVQYYPDTGSIGDTRIVEITWPPAEAPALPQGVTQPPALTVPDK